MRYDRLVSPEKQQRNLFESSWFCPQGRYVFYCDRRSFCDTFRSAVDQDTKIFKPAVGVREGSKMERLYAGEAF